MTPSHQSGKPDQRASGEPLREAIDSGRTGDKVPGGDPAASPLGTDDEASGAPVTSRQLEAALERETDRGPGPGSREAADGRTWRRSGLWAAIGIAAAVVVVLLLLSVGA